MTAHDLSRVFARMMQRTHFYDADLNDVEPNQVNQPDWTGDSLLHIAAMVGAVDELTVLLENGAFVDARGENKMTPLHYAAMKGHRDAVKVLLSHGADVNIRDADGKRAVDWVASIGDADLFTRSNRRKK